MVVGGLWDGIAVSITAARKRNKQQQKEGVPGTIPVAKLTNPRSENHQFSLY
jgi:hypothetical protein